MIAVKFVKQEKGKLLKRWLDLMGFYPLETDIALTYRFKWYFEF